MRSRVTLQEHRAHQEQESAARRAASKAANLQHLVDTPARTLHTAVMAPAPTTCTPILKGPKAKPGKGAPNKEERAWMDWITARGCVACRKDGTLVVGADGVYEPERPQVHHIIRGNRRIGHLWTLPLCAGHHQDGHGKPGMVARHPTKARFEAKYGSEFSLLAELQLARDIETRKTL